MISNLILRACAATCLFGPILSSATRAADDPVNTVVYSWVSPEYLHERFADGSLKPEYYAISNGGRVPGTTTDSTVDKITYPEIAKIAMKLLAGQGYHYGMTAAQAKLLLVLQWGQTIPYNRVNYDAGIANAASAMSALQNSGAGSNSLRADENDGRFNPFAGAEQQAANSAVDSALLQIRIANSVREQNNRANAWLLGYLGEIDAANNIQRYTGMGDRYYDLLGEIEESRYYIIISAYDFKEVLKQGKPKLLWVTRVSVFTRRNQFDETMAPMLKSAAKYFGQASGGLIRGEETKGRVDLGELKFLGTVEDAKAADPGQNPKAAAGAKADSK